MKTENEIKEDVYQHIKGTPLELAVTGIVTTKKRPKDSTSEDITITVLASDTEQRQEAVVNVNIYVREKLEGGQYVEDDTREALLSKLAAECLIVGGIGKDYRFRLESQHTFEVENDKRHERCINNKLTYNFYNEE